MRPLSTILYLQLQPTIRYGSYSFQMAPAEPNAIPFQLKGEAPSFPDERDGWKGYIEWEDYDEKREKAEALLNEYDFPDVSPPPGSSRYWLMVWEAH